MWACMNWILRVILMVIKCNSKTCSNRVQATANPLITATVIEIATALVAVTALEKKDY